LEEIVDMSESLAIPVDFLDKRLIELVPFGERIVCSSRAKIAKPGWSKPSKYGYLVLTASGVAFRADEEQSEKEDFEDYVPYIHMTEVKNKKGTVEFKIKNPEKPGEARSWKLTVEKCDREDKGSFKKREELFARTFEDLMKRRLAIYF
jgi:hypothetical protein